MIKPVFVIFDTAAACGEIPFVMRTEAEVLRQFEDLCIRDGSRIAEHPEHYSLFEIGNYDDTTMEIKAHPPRCVATGVEMVAKSRQIAPGSLKEKVNGEISDGTQLQSGAESEDTSVEL